MPSLTVENYVKTIYQLEHQTGTAGNGVAGMPGSLPAVATGQIAAALAVLPGTVTSMLKTLSESSLASYAPYEGARLAPGGKSLALRVMRRHRLIELFLVRTLNLSWDEVHEEAEHMEHAVSDFLVDRIDAYLGFPATDPHGDPIPAADGSLATSAGRTLAQCAAGDSVQVARVRDQSPEFLRYLTESGLSLGARGHVLVNHSEAGIVSLQVEDREVTLGREAAEQILVAPADEAAPGG